MSAMGLARARELDRRSRGPVPRPPFGRFFYPGLLILFGNGVIAAVIYGGGLDVRNPGKAWLEAIAAQVVAIVIVSLLPKRIFLVQVRRLTLNFAMAIPLLGAYVAGPIFGVPAAVGFIFAGVSAVMYWAADPRTVRYLARRLEREGLLPRE